MDVFSNKTTKTSALIFKEFSLCQANRHRSTIFKMIMSVEKKVNNFFCGEKQVWHFFF